MSEIGEKRNYDQMSPAELWSVIKSRKVISVEEEYYSTEKLLEIDGFKCVKQENFRADLISPCPAHEKRHL